MVPKYILKTIYYSLVGSHFNYGLLVWGSKSSDLMNLQKKIIRIISGAHFLSHTERLFKKEKILKISDTYKLNCLKLYFKFENSQLPANIESLFVKPLIDEHRYPTSNRLARETYRLRERFATSENAKSLISYNLPKVVNSMPNLIVDKVFTHSFESYKKYASNYFLNNYSDENCVDPNCYSCNFIQTAS